MASDAASAHPDDAVGRASRLTVGELFRTRARLHPGAPALAGASRTLTYGELDERVNRLANALSALGIERGDRIAVLSENRPEYVEIVLAAARVGAIVCAQNWRLAPPELEHCVRLTTPRLALVSDRHRAALAATDHGVGTVVGIDGDYEALLAGASPAEAPIAAEPEDGLVLLYTSGTTGLPKGALISHRAEIARGLVCCADLDLRRGDTFVAWPPFFHMASMDHALAVLALGGNVIVVDGFDLERLVDLVAAEPMWWLILMPGTVDRFCEAMRARGARPAGVRLVGAMADLVPRHQIAEATALLGAPYLNSFGSTETGIPPASAGRIPVGEAPLDLAKSQCSLCEIRLVDAADADVPDGTPGELAIRGPTLFSGYWNAPETNARDFRGGWFHLGDAFVREPDGRLRFVDRVKYLIKSGGENVYPAEIEQVLLADPRVDEAVVVRRTDPTWGEVPVAVVARNDPALTAEALIERCRAALAGYKRPREVHFVALESFPRSTTGKVQRHEVERWVADGALPPA